MALVVGGTVLLLAVLLDALATTLSVGSGAGPLTRVLLDRIWGGLLRLPIALRRRLLPRAGAALVVLTELLWVAALWLGWSMVFLGSHAVVSNPGGRSATPLDVVYFAGASMLTLGPGDYVAASEPWRLVSVLAGLSGLVLITLAITFLLSDVAAVVERRSVATSVSGLGSTATGAVVDAWDGERLSRSFLRQLVRLGETVSSNAEKHLAYPVVQYFHASDRELSAPSALAQLDDVLSLLAHGLAPGSRPSVSAVRPVRRGLERYLAAMSLASGEDCPVPPVPTLEPLRRAGVPVVDDEQFHAALAEHADHRRRLHGLVRNDDWDWPASA